MINKTKRNLGKTIIALSLIGFTAGLTSWADQTIQVNPFVVQSVTGSGCPGTYTGYAKMTNSSGTYLITSATNDANATFKDISGYPSPYVSVVQVTRQSDNKKWCDTNTVTFPATNGGVYKFTAFVKSPLPPPTNSDSLTLQINW